MDHYVTREGPIDPEVRAYVYSLVTALGGSSASEDGRYVLGDDALACLKDIKRWLKLHDEKLSRLDVTRCLAEANLVKGDLLEILGSWAEDTLDNRWKGKIALACFELLVPLTWPMEQDIANSMTRNQHRHLPYVQIAQVNYKREILEHPSGDVLRKAIRLVLPGMATTQVERTPRDEGILRLVLYFIRNMAMISAPAHLPVEWNEQEVSRSATIRAFEQQDVFTLLLTISSNLAEDFKNQDVLILEVLFHLLKGLDPTKLFLSRTERTTAASKDLQGLMDKEEAMLRSYNRHAPTRHNRFGTMIWLKRDNEKVSTISGQDVLMSDQKALEKMDKSKKWNRPKRARKEPERNYMNFDLPEILADDANEPLRKFVENFLDSGFNPLFESLRRAIEREAERRQADEHDQQYWYLISWLLRAESIRRKVKRADEQKEGRTAQFDSFGIVASVLNQETFILLNRYMQKAYDDKHHNELDAAMRCFTQILTTVQEMADSPFEEDQEIAENIQNRIFYEESTHDRILAILRNYKDQNFSYLDAITELSHVFLRMLERYSKENGDLQIRSRRKARRKKDEQEKNGENVDGNPDDGSEAADNAAAASITRERKFSFERFAAKFVNQATVNTFAKFLVFYHDLSPDQLKRIHRFFYRTAFKQDMGVLLYRMDIIILLNRMMKSSQPLNKSHPMFQEWEELIRQLFKRLVKKLQKRSELAIELLFSKIPATCYYLEFGREKQTIASQPRPPAELEVRGAFNHEEQIGIVVAVLMGEQKSTHVDWVIKVFQEAADERKAWEAQSEAIATDSADKAAESADESHNTDAMISNAAGENDGRPVTSLPPHIGVKPDDEPLRVALFKDNKFRLLLTLSGAERIGEREDMDAAWRIPDHLKSAQLFDTIVCIQGHRNNPKNTYGNEEDGNPIPAAEYLKRVAPVRANRYEDLDPAENPWLDVDDGEDDGLDDFLAGNDEHLFPAGGPTNRKSALADLAKKRRRRRGSDAEEVDEETLDARRKARALKELEKRRKIKSEEFVHDSDDEDEKEGDEAFFAKEREIAARRQKRYEEEIRQRKEELALQAGGKGKRKRAVDSEAGKQSKRLRSSDDEDDGGSADDAIIAESDDDLDGMGEVDSDPEDLFVAQRLKAGNRSTSPIEVSEHEESSEPDEEETPNSSQSAPHVEKLALAEMNGNVSRLPDDAASKMQVDAPAEEEDEDAMPTQTRRRTMRPTVLDDSDDE